MKGTTMVEQLRAQARIELARFDAATERLADRRRRTSDRPSEPAERESAPDELQGVSMDRCSVNPG